LSPSRALALALALALFLFWHPLTKLKAGPCTTTAIF
jgi:hypothetical protein